MSSTTPIELDERDRQALIAIAAASVRAGVQGDSLSIDVNDVAPALREPRATFVTLTKRGELRGCIGTLEPVRPLALDVAANAHAAAFRDPRFLPVTADEAKELAFHISVLNPPQPMSFASEEDLIRQLRPGIDGLILSDGLHRATFLPAVWESVDDPREFLRHLKLKAGFAPDRWSSTIKAERYTVSSIP